jgi:type IV pilus assembly protein PilE
VGKDDLMRMKSLSESALAEEKGFTLIELIVVIAIVAILAGIASSIYQGMINRAYKITLKHDLNNFAKAEENYFIDHASYFGDAGSYIKGGSSPSGTLSPSVLNFSPSDGVKIEITSGPPSFKAEASHEKADVAYEYDFVTRQMTER